MGLFGWNSPDIQRGVEQYRATADALLVDVREPDEYRQGRIPGSRNVPLSALHTIIALTEDRDKPLFVYCLSGARSRRAVAQLREMGYRNVTDLGGISRYRGELER